MGRRIKVTSGTGETSHELCVTGKSRFPISRQLVHFTVCSLDLCYLGCSLTTQRAVFASQEVHEMSTWPWNKESRLRICFRHRWAARDLDHNNEQRQLREWPWPWWKIPDTKPPLRSCSTNACFFLCFLSVISEIQHEMTKYREGFPDLLFKTCELLALVHFIPNLGH